MLRCWRRKLGTWLVSPSRRELMLAARFGAAHDAFVDVFPAVLHFAVGFDEQAKSAVMEFDQRAALLFAQAVLEIVGYWVRHKERAEDFEQRRRLDGLNGAPVMANAVDEVAETAATE